MADILIRMEMPETCGQCPIFNYDYNICNFLSTHHHEYETSRIDGCPLHELPEHGDLIDRDAFNAFICKSCGDRCNCESIETDCISCESAFRCDFVPLLKTAPVIVPSNKEETE